MHTNLKKRLILRSPFELGGNVKKVVKCRGYEFKFRFEPKLNYEFL